MIKKILQRIYLKHFFLYFFLYLLYKMFLYLVNHVLRAVSLFYYKFKKAQFSFIEFYLFYLGFITRFLGLKVI